jgi:hypothetical protein
MKHLCLLPRRERGNVSDFSISSVVSTLGIILELQVIILSIAIVDGLQSIFEFSDSVSKTFFFVHFSGVR